MKLDPNSWAAIARSAFGYAVAAVAAIVVNPDFKSMDAQHYWMVIGSAAGGAVLKYLGQLCSEQAKVS